MKYTPAIFHLWQQYTAHWKCPAKLELTGEVWQLQGRLRSLQIPCYEKDLLPSSLHNAIVIIDNKSLLLPMPSEDADWDEAHWLFTGDLLHFLAGQLWRFEDFVSTQALAAREAKEEGYLGAHYAFFDRPIVDLWMRALLEYLDGHCATPQAKVWLSYDVDCLRKWKTLPFVKHLLRFPWDILRGKGKIWISQVHEALRSKDPERDPWYTIPFMLEQLQGFQSTFFWLGHPKDHKSSRYDIRLPEYKKLVQKCKEAGHQIGLHGSPLHAKNAALLRQEKQILDSVAQENILLHRQHYLRIEPGQTLRHLSHIGIQMDSTMGFNRRVGFRCGSCVPMQWWDFQSQNALSLVEVPLIVGDWTLHDPLHFDPTSSLQKIQEMLEWTRLAGGVMTLDFHELYFSTDYPQHAQFHQELLHIFKKQAVMIWTPKGNNT